MFGWNSNSGLSFSSIINFYVLSGGPETSKILAFIGIYLLPIPTSRILGF